jgi:hypothetical protein
MMSETIPGLETIDMTFEELVPYEETDDPNARAHYVNPAMNQDIQKKYGYMETPQEIVDTARLFGLEVTALCGYKWIPSHNPKKFEVCSRCAEIAGDIILSGVE